MQPEFILHVWPGKWDLPSIDPPCIAAVFYLQLSIPGKFFISECINPDFSTTGQLPYLTHGHRVVSPLSSIIKYVAGLQPSRKYGDLDSTLSTTEKAQRVAWFAHIETNFGDLVAHVFLSLNDNWWKLTHPMYASVLPVPQRYYVPGRIRETFKPRLEASELWNLPGMESEERSLFAPKEKGRKDEKDAYGRIFKREKVLEKARSVLDMYARLLGSKKYFFCDRPTTLDVLLAAHVLLITIPPFPDPLLKSLVVDSYPTLVAHGNLIRSHAFPLSGKQILSGIEVISQMPPISPPRRYSLLSLLPLTALGKSKPKSADEVRFTMLRWRWMGLAVTGLVGYVMLARAGGRAEKIDAGAQAQESEEVDLL